MPSLPRAKHRRGTKNETPVEDPFSPVTAISTASAPRATIDKDTTKSWFRRIVPIIMTHRLAFISALVLSFIGLMIQVQIPIVLRWAFTNAVAPIMANRQNPTHLVATHSILPYAYAIAGLGVAAGIAGYFSRRFLYDMAYNFEFDLRNLLYEHFTKMSFSFFDRVQTGQLISRANSDIRSVQMYTTFAPLILVNCSIAVVAFAYMVSIDWVLALVAMATMPLIYIVGLKMRKDMFPLSWIIQARLADVATIVDENVNGVRVVKSFAAEQRQLNELSNAAERVKWAYVKDADLRAKWTPLIQNLPQVGLILVLLFGGIMVINGRLRYDAILTFNLYLFMMQAPFQMLGMLVMMGQRAAASADRIFEILDEEPAIVDAPGAKLLPADPGSIVFRDVDFAYGHERHTKGGEITGAGATSDLDPHFVLKNFSLTITPGETVAIVGRTGSGKSTIARLLTRFYDVTSGTISIGDLDVRDVTLTSLRARVGLVLDEPFLFSASVHDNIAYGRPDATDHQVKEAAIAAGASGFIERLEAGFDTVVGERGYTLSGGQRQRIAIARTLLVNPPILVLDDATSAIDVHVEQQIHAALERLFANRTTLIVAHRLSTISLAKRVVLIDEGRIVADGTHAELLESVPLYGEVLAQAAALDPIDDALDESSDLQGAR